MIGHILVAYEARLPRGTGQRGNQRVRKPVIAPRSHFETADVVIVKRQAARLYLFSALGARRLVGYNKKADFLFLHLVGCQRGITALEVDQPRSDEPIDLLAASCLLGLGKLKMKRHLTRKPRRYSRRRGAVDLHGKIAFEIAPMSCHSRLNKRICAYTLNDRRKKEDRQEGYQRHRCQLPPAESRSSKISERSSQYS